MRWQRGLEVKLLLPTERKEFGRHRKALNKHGCLGKLLIKGCKSLVRDSRNAITLLGTGEVTVVIQVLNSST
ncbi:hypothetical protein AXF41_13620 [Clostridium haemolyticum]|nr:hypothetical protein AXF41_13635 [Clostridium haemolyticum]OOB74980.1 hypothetical protein AXF41_13620 [Clostridium haemolyticum]